MSAGVASPLSTGRSPSAFGSSVRVVLDTDLAAFYGETTKRFNQQVNRHRERFPEDFMFQLSDEEFAHLRLQSASSSKARVMAAGAMRRWRSRSTARSWPPWCWAARVPRH